MRIQQSSVLRLGLALVLALSMTSIGFESLQAEQKPTLTMWEWHSTEIPETMEWVYTTFEEEYGIHIDVETYPWEDVHQKIPMGAEAGTMPDLVEFNANFLLSSLVAKGSLASLDSYIEKRGGKEFLDRLKPNSVLKERGHIYSLPLLLWKHDLIYNTRLFKEKYDPPKDWDELEAIAEKLTDKEKGIYGFGIPGASGETILYFANFVAQNDGRLGLPPGSPRVPEEVKIEDIGVNKPKSVEAIKFALNLVKKYGPPFAGADSKRIRDLFIAGRIAMYYEGADAIVFMTHPEMDFRIGTDRMPIGPVGKLATVNDYGNCQIGISASSKHKDLAYKFLTFITSDRVQKKLAEGSAMVPGVNAADEALLLSRPRMWPAIESLKASEPKWKVVAAYRSLPPQLLAATDIFNTEIQKAYLGRKTVQEAMDTVAQKWEELWSEWRRKYGPSK